ncbi:MAG: DUF2490 domain-containing protein [Acidobacteria bacterium]|nr:DUF2490 domain-containing protein [Acidobacteriota bacterium]
MTSPPASCASSDPVPRVLIVALVLAGALLLPGAALAQTPVDRDQLGAWYMLFWSTRFDDTPLGLQGDVQHRNWNMGTDLEQLLIRGGLTYQLPAAPVLVTGGVAHITSGAFGVSDETSAERRVYQEALVRQAFGRVVFLRHRYRYEQRWVDGQDFRTRFRYALFGDVALNGRGTGNGSVYLALYNEVFVNGELEIGQGRTVERFDRNRFYTALGFGISDGSQLQAGYMIQTVPGGSKGQIQVSLHTRF